MTRDSTTSVWQGRTNSDPDATSRSNKSMTLSAVTFAGHTLTAMLGCIGIIILWTTTGSNGVIKFKCVVSHLASVSVGAAGCYGISMTTGVLPTCVGQDEKEMVRGYESWAKKQLSNSPETRKKRQSVFWPGQDLTTRTTTSTVRPATSPTTPTSLAPRKDQKEEEKQDQKEGKEEKEEKEKEEKTQPSAATPGPAHQLTPTYAPLQESDRDLGFLDANFPLDTVSTIICVTCVICVLNCILNYVTNCANCVFKKNPSTPRHQPQSVHEGTTPITWEDTLAERGLAGLIGVAQRTTPSPPPFPNNKDVILV